jgi:hypothetical protein
VALALSLISHCPAAAPRTDAQTTGTFSIPAKQIAAEVAEHELKYLQYGAPFVRYQMHTVDAKGEQIRDVIQSKDGAVARLISRDNRPLTPDEDAAERARLQAMIDSPATYLKHARGDSTGKKTASDIIKLMPQAMIYTYVEGQPQRVVPGRNSADPEIVIDYKPDPAWSPPTMASEALLGLQGRMWVDAKTHALVAIDGNIFRAVNFGFFVAHIYPGGTLSLEQAEVVPNKTFFTHFVQHLTLRVPLIFKTIRENSDVTSFGFTQVPPMTYQEAIHELLASPLPTR